MTSSKATTWTTSWCSRQESDFVDHGPSGASEISEEREIGIGGGALRAGPGRVHGLAVVKVEFDDGIPSGVLAAGIGCDVVLAVALEPRKISGQRCVDLFEMLEELSLSQIGPAIEDDHELQHDFDSSGFDHTGQKQCATWKVGDHDVLVNGVSTVSDSAHAV